MRPHCWVMVALAGIMSYLSPERALGAPQREGEEEEEEEGWEKLSVMLEKRRREEEGEVSFEQASTWGE